MEMICTRVCDGTSPMSGEGLFNQASLSTNGTTLEAEDCGDIPALVIAKTFDSAAPNNDGTFTVNYTVTVENTGGATGTYGLEDTPGFDDDITINSGTFTGQNNGSLASGTNTLATNESIAAGATHTYNLSFVVTLDLTDGSGDDMYSVCDGTSPMSGEGLFNQASLSTNGTTLEAEDCGDIPALVIAKTFDSATPNNDGTFTVTYTVTVENTGGASGMYDLEDTPGFDDDITINSGMFSGQASGPLNTSGSTTLAYCCEHIAGATHTYNLSFNVTLDLTDGSGDDIYSVCDGTSPMSGEGLFNQASLSTNGTTLEAEDCGDIPALVIAKTFDSTTPNGGGTFTVNYTVTVENTGGASGTYDLEDTPGFDDDITIISGTFSSTTPPNLSGMLMAGGNTLATAASIAAGATHTYNLSFVVTLDLTDGTGDDMYSACDGTSPMAGEGLFNTATLTTNGVSLDDESCGDLIDDPAFFQESCLCNNDAEVNEEESGTFSEFFVVTGLNGGILPPGQTWTITSVAGAYELEANTEQVAGIGGASELTAGQILSYCSGPGDCVVYTGAESGTELIAPAGSYYLDLAHIDNIGYSITIEGPFAEGDPRNIEESFSTVCFYPELGLVGNSTVCLDDGAFPITATPIGGTFDGDASFVGGTPPYSTITQAGLTDNGDGTASFDPAAAGLGTHTVSYVYKGMDAPGTVAPGCWSAVEYELEVKANLDIAGTVSDVSCNGAADGSISITVTPDDLDPVPAYTYLWSNGETTQNISGLSGGNYSVTVSHPEACAQQTAFFFVEEPTELIAEIISSSDVSCNGGWTEVPR